MPKQYVLKEGVDQLDSLSNRVLTKRTPLLEPDPALIDSQMRRAF
jgi:hypothetical protein